MLEKLYIRGCEELKDIITNEAEDDDHLNCTSIFPNLQSLYVSDCNKLEFMFPSTLSGGLQKLKSIGVLRAGELKFVFGRYDDEECVSNENENDQLQIPLPALETLSVRNAPKMINICAKKYYLSFPSLQRLELADLQEFNERSFLQFMASLQGLQLNVTTPKGSCLMRQSLSLQNIREMTLERCSKLKSLFSVSVATTMIMLETLKIKECEELKDIITNEAKDDDHLNCTSIFPKLQSLEIFNCNKLEFIFPPTLSGGLQKLKSIGIDGAEELKYVFERYDDEECVSNENENDQLQIHLPALETLSVRYVPKMISICSKKYYLSFPSLQRIVLEELQQINERSFLHLMASLQRLQLNVTAPKDWMKIIKDVQKLTKLEVSFLKIEEVLDLEGVEIEGPELILSLEELLLINLSELRHIWKGPKYMLSLLNLSQLHISACKKLRAIFSVSIVKRLPQLSCLRIEDCDELVDIIEESLEDHLHQLCFPKLETIHIKCCNSLKCLFSILTPAMFPQLTALAIEEASKLEQVFIHKQYDMQNMTIMEVFPKLSYVLLIKLPMLITICEGIDFQDCEVHDCPKYQGTNHIQEGTENGDSENQAATNALPNFAESSKDAMKRSVEEVVSSMRKEEIVKEIETHDPTPALEEQPSKASIADEPQLRRSTLQNNKETEKEDSRVVPDPASKLLATTSSVFQSIDVILTERSEQSPTLEDVAVADLKPRNSSVYKETEKEVGKAIPASSLPATTSPDFEVIVGQPRTEQNLSLKETEKKDVRRHASQLPIAPTFTNLKTYKEKEMEVGKGIVASRLPATTSLNFESGASSIHSQSDLPAQVANIKETHEQVSQEDDATKEATIAIQSTDSESRKQTRRLEETEKEAVKTHPSQLSMASTLTNPKSNIKNIPKDSTPTIADISISLVHSQAEDSHSDPPAQSSKEAMKISVEEVASSVVPTSKEERVREIEAKDATLALEEQAPKGPTAEAKLRTPLYSVESFQEETITMEAKIDTSSSCLQVEDSQSGPSTMVGIMEEIVKHDFQKHASPNDDPVAIQFTNQELIKQPRGSRDMPLGKKFSETAKETRDTNVPDGPKSEKAEMANLLTSSCDIKPNIPMEDNTNLPNVIPSSHHQSQTGAASSSPPILEIGEIFQLVELKDAEPALLAKALALYPQLRLSGGQRTHPIISFSYRVLVDILVTLATKTPYTITASDRTTLEANLGAATFLGFDKDWIELVRAKVFGIDRSDALVEEERISIMEEELEKCDKALECMQKKRMEAKEKLAMVQNEFDAVDTQLFDLLENRRNLVMKMTEFRKRTSAKDKPFGI